ncbi:SMP-30/gluconolactonase/LRE family protein [Daejeonella sp.]|uniref:SMP-30/gluconolactonase/LRE family protein n=1 Tax=Daejeonella sp. TaxID=2805397 RepID=UPI0030BF5987
MIASILCKCECILGEGPLWLPEKEMLMWVDIERKLIYEYDWVSRKTTARQELTDEELKRYPESGNVFCVKTTVKGLPTKRCKFKKSTDSHANHIFYQKLAFS